MKIELSVDPHDQWFVSVWVTLNQKSAPVTFKVDNGCNALVLSHDTLKKLGISTNVENLDKLPNKIGKLASGEKRTFKSLGSVSLFQPGKKQLRICDANAICHATHETNDLMGTEVFKQFTDVHFRLIGNKYMELLK
ncbi:MAG: retropepsin-like domain-containing protein [Defluviitaleaceae bacterium]|nr:retropepsin-like domain-containing protein [Defluviitaleaceae bacterium]